MDIKEFAQKFIEAEDDAWKNGNCDALQALETPDVVYHMLIMGDQDQVGWEAHKEYILGMRQMAPEIHQEWNYVAGDGNVFSLSYKSQSKFENEVPMLSIPAGGTAATNALFVFRLEGNRIAEAWCHGNMAVQ